MSVVSSQISFQKTACLPGKNLCTPEHATVEQTGPGRYHIVLPGNLEWGAAISNPSGRPVAIDNARGSVCHQVETLGAAGCAGPSALIQRTAGSNTSFAIEQPGSRENEGYLEFDVRVQ